LSDIIELKSCSISKYSDHIILIKFKDGAEVLLEDAIEIRDESIKLFKGERFLALIDASDILGSVTHDAREYFAKDEKLTEVRMAQAIVVNNLAISLLANFYITFNKPERKAKIFKSVEEAVKWLETQRHLLQ